jgi:hypothetical protein
MTDGSKGVQAVAYGCCRGDGHGRYPKTGQSRVPPLFEFGASWDLRRTKIARWIAFDNERLSCSASDLGR